MSSKRTYKMLSLKDVVDGLSNRAFRRYGFARKEILVRWPEIVGPAMAECSAPERLSFGGKEKVAGTLHIRVEGSLALEIQHFETIILERINGFYGYEAVAKLRLHQGPIYRNIRRGKKPKVIILTDEQKTALEEQLSGIKDKKLHQTLYDLGAGFMVSEEKQEKTNSGQKRFGRRGMGRSNANRGQGNGE